MPENTINYQIKKEIGGAKLALVRDLLDELNRLRFAHTISEEYIIPGQNVSPKKIDFVPKSIF